MPLVEKHRDGAAEDVEEEDAALLADALGSRGPSLAGGLRGADRARGVCGGYPRGSAPLYFFRMPFPLGGPLQ